MEKEKDVGIHSFPSTREKNLIEQNKAGRKALKDEKREHNILKGLFSGMETDYSELNTKYKSLVRMLEAGPVANNVDKNSVVLDAVELPYYPVFIKKQDIPKVIKTESYKKLPYMKLIDNKYVVDQKLYQKYKGGITL